MTIRHGTETLEQVCAIARADAEKIRALAELASGLLIGLSHVSMAANISEAKRLARDGMDWADKNRAKELLALAATQSPRSEAGEDVK